MTKVAEGNNKLNALLSDYNPNINFDKWLISYLEIENQIDAEFESLYAYTEAISKLGVNVYVNIPRARGVVFLQNFTTTNSQLSISLKLNCNYLKFKK